MARKRYDLKIMRTRFRNPLLNAGRKFQQGSKDYDNATIFGKELIDKLSLDFPRIDISNQQTKRKYAPNIEEKTTLDLHVRKKRRKQAEDALKQVYQKSIEGDGDLTRFIGPSINGKNVTTYRIIDSQNKQLTEINIYAQKH
jgi:ribosomal protein L28